MDLGYSHTEDQIIRLEVVAEDEENGEIADIDEVGRSIFEQLARQSFTYEAQGKYEQAECVYLRPN